MHQAGASPFGGYLCLLAWTKSLLIEHDLLAVAESLQRRHVVKNTHIAGATAPTFFLDENLQPSWAACAVRSICVTPHRPERQEKMALHCLYKSTDGPGWACNEGWDSVFDSNLSTLYGVSTEAGRVTKISLGANNLEGSSIVSPQPVSIRPAPVAQAEPCYCSSKISAAHPPWQIFSWGS